TPRACAPRPESSRPAARWPSALASNAPACPGPCAGPTLLSPFVAASSADAFRISGSADRHREPRKGLNHFPDVYPARWECLGTPYPPPGAEEGVGGGGAQP